MPGFRIICFLLIIQSAKEREDAERVFSGPEYVFAERQLIVERAVPS